MKQISQLFCKVWRQHPVASQVLTGEEKDTDVSTAGDIACISTLLDRFYSSDSHTQFYSYWSHAFHHAAGENLAHFKQNTPARYHHHTLPLLSSLLLNSLI